MRCGLRIKYVAKIVFVHNYTATLFLPAHQNSLSHSNSLWQLISAFFSKYCTVKSHKHSISAQKEILEVISSLSPFFSMKSLSPHRLAQYHRYSVVKWKQSKSSTEREKLLDWDILEIKQLDKNHFQLSVLQLI